ncbi:MAG: ParB/RepB/Spo0J family partition protein [Alphaproteobacteria bacterium]
MDNRLGKGLSFLMGDDVVSDINAMPEETIKRVAVKELSPSRFQPRRIFKPEALQDLVASIQTKGVLQPLLVRPKSLGGYEIIAGERRYRAAQQAGLVQVPVIIKDFNDKDALEVALIENLQREDLNPIEEAEAYARLMKEFTYTQETLAEVLGKSRSYIANTLRLLELPQSIRKMLEEKQITPGHARTLVGVPKAEELALQIINQGMTVREVEKTVEIKKHPPKKSVHLNEKDEDIQSLEQDLTQKLGMKVQLKWNGKKGILSFTYKSPDQLQELLKKFL